MYCPGWLGGCERIWHDIGLVPLGPTFGAIAANLLKGRKSESYSGKKKCFNACSPNLLRAFICSNPLHMIHRDIEGQHEGSTQTEYTVGVRCFNNGGDEEPLLTVAKKEKGASNWCNTRPFFGCHGYVGLWTWTDISISKYMLRTKQHYAMLHFGNIVVLTIEGGRQWTKRKPD